MQELKFDIDSMNLLFCINIYSLMLSMFPSIISKPFVS